MGLTLYIKPWCPWCVEAVAWLEERGYEFTKIDVLRDPVASERMRRISKQSLTPTLETSDGAVLPDFDVAQLENFMLKVEVTTLIISHLLLVLGAAVLSAALRSFQNPLLFRLGTLGIVATSFLAGWLLGGSVALGALLAASWLFLPWLEILTKVRRLRLPIERRLEPRTPPARNSFPDFEKMTTEIENRGYVHLEDVGWDYQENRHFYRVFHQPDSRTQASICLTEQRDMAFHYLTITSRTKDGRVFMTWNYPFSYGLKLQPHLFTNRFLGGGPFAEMHTAHEQFLRLREVNPSNLLDPSPEETIRTMQNEMRAQITHNIALGLLVQDGDHFIRYTMRGMVYLWFQFLRDLVRLS